MIIHKKSLILATAVSLLALFFDQWSKEYIISYLAEKPHAEAHITSFFDLVLVRNYGISFGMFAGHNQPAILTLGALVIIAVLIRWLFKTERVSTACAIGAVIGGAVGNVIDRQRLGAVTDFLDFHVNHYHWPAFNIADSAIFMGVVVLSVQSMFEPSKKPSE